MKAALISLAVLPLFAGGPRASAASPLNDLQLDAVSGGATCVASGACCDTATVACTNYHLLGPLTVYTVAGGGRGLQSGSSNLDGGSSMALPAWAAAIFKSHGLTSVLSP